jgi:hypothetical protein
MNISDIDTEFCMDFILIIPSIVKPLSVVCIVIAVVTRDLAWNIKRDERGVWSNK